MPAIRKLGVAAERILLCYSGVDFSKLRPAQKVRHRLLVAARLIREKKIEDVLEVFARGSYFWVPLEQIDSLAMSAPRVPRDLIWAPARLEMDVRATPGVVGTGLFLGMADTVLVGDRKDFRLIEERRRGAR